MHDQKAPIEHTGRRIAECCSGLAAAPRRAARISSQAAALRNDWSRPDRPAASSETSTASRYSSTPRAAVSGSALWCLLGHPKQPPTSRPTGCPFRTYAAKRSGATANTRAEWKAGQIGSDGKRRARPHKAASRACSLRASARIEAVVRAGRRCWSQGVTNGADRRIAPCSYHQEEEPGGPPARSLRDRRDHRAADRGEIAFDGRRARWCWRDGCRASTEAIPLAVAGVRLLRWWRRRAGGWREAASRTAGRGRAGGSAAARRSGSRGLREGERASDPRLARVVSDEGAGLSGRMRPSPQTSARKFSSEVMCSAGSVRSM